MATYASWIAQQKTHKRKGLVGAVLVGDITATLPTALTASDSSLVTKPTGYTDAGYTTTDGVVISRKVDSSDVHGWQSPSSPLRSDVTSDTETFKVSFHETNIETVALYFGIAKSALVGVAASGEVAWAKSALPDPIYFRALVLAKDKADGGDVFLAESYPRCKVTDWDDMTYANTDDGVLYGITVTAFVDDTAGYSRKSFRGGLGWKSLTTSMGFTLA